MKTETFSYLPALSDEQVTEQDQLDATDVIDSALETDSAADGT